nr:hypothetical protein [uncultured Holophaga sp.]
MYVPTTTGVLPLTAMEARGFGTLAPAGFALDDGGHGLELCPCAFTATAYTGDLVQVQEGIVVPATAVLLSDWGVWKEASALASGDALVVWTDGVPGLVTLETAPVATSGDGVLVCAGETGVIYGASESGPWVLGR